jgi:AcrR family transcriptional regulator
VAKKKIVPPALGRKANYFARNRQAIIAGTQEVLAEFGPEATIDQIAERTGLAVSTLYMHFSSKEELFEITLQSAFFEWEAWVREHTSNISNDLERLVAPMRVFVRVKKTHPHYAKLVAKNFETVSQIMPLMTLQLQSEINNLVNLGKLKTGDVAIKAQNIAAVVLAQLREQLTNPKTKPEDADKAIEIAVAMLGISPAVAKKITTANLPI